MKPVLIADYLNGLGQDARGEPRRDNAPLRLRPVLAAKAAEPRASTPVFRTLNPAAMITRPRASAQRHEAEPAKWPAAQDTGPAANFETRIEEAYERGRRDPLAGARAELEQDRASFIAAQQERIIVERLDFHLNEYAQLANVIAAGLIEIEERICASVARIVHAFVDSGARKQIVDELCANIGRLRAGASPPLIRIRGPERLLHVLRERIADAAAEVEYIVQDGVEAIVEAQDTIIESQLQPWADLLASIDRAD